MKEVQQVRVDDLIQDKAMQVRRYLDDDVVDQYVTCFDDLPPVEVVDAPEGKILADGFHRVGAAKRLGRTHIAANVREGTREDAEVIALLANTTHGAPLKPWEREDAVLRLHKLRPDWSKRELARILAVSEGTVRNLLKDQKIRYELKQSGVPEADDLKVSVRAQIYAAPPDLRPDLAAAAASKGWTAEQVRDVTQVMTDPQLPEVDKRLALAGVVPKPRTPEQEEEEERRHQEEMDRLLSVNPYGTRAQPLGPGIARLRSRAGVAMWRILDDLLSHDPRELAKATEAHEHAAWAQYIQRIRRWMDDFEEAAAADNWVVDDLP